MTRSVLILLLALTGCGQPAGTTTTTTSSVNTTSTGAGTTTDTVSSTTSTTTGPPTAAALGLQPGKWQTTVAVRDIEINGKHRATVPGMSADAVTTCLTPEQAAKGPGEFLKKAGAECTTTSASYGNGKISASMTCKMPMGTLTSTTTGTYSPTQMSSDAEATITGRMSIKEKIHTEARRVGDCS